jgi:hypothetical protein
MSSGNPIRPLNAKVMTASIDKKNPKLASIALWTADDQPYEIRLSTVTLARLRESIEKAMGPPGQNVRAP